MRIGIVALNYAPGTIGGAESYYTDLIKYLQNVDNKNTYVLFMRDSYSDLLPIKNDNFSLKRIGHSKPAQLLYKVIKKLLRVDIEQRIINAQNCDLLHFPFQVVNFSVLKSKIVSTAIDIQEEFYPEFFSPEDLASRKRLHRLSAERSDFLVAISDFTRKTYIENYGVSKDKIQTVHLSYNEQLYTDQKTTKELSLPKNYFYYPAATWPHKNHQNLIKAFSMFSKEHPDYSLVLSGIKKQKSEEIDALINELGLSGKVVIMGYIERRLLPELHKRAIGLVFPSLFEGFGIPVLEAMASGCPVACSNTSSLPEVGGNAALYFDPTIPEAIAGAMEELAGNEAKRKAMITQGLAWAKKFSAQRTAQETLKVYQKVGGQK